ncbi:ABC transporter permease [Fuscovulum ytuae]|uniref:ABC transporter permease n=1 Tax=Fuscovulum ytuae TaxID=3042299 RepID=A0ABY8Q7H9_9RHOB|nr:ABC transporter permease [Fuscovulum sp. YMD61]WGV16813.1 ABC transporter permease [Fuscovulum sp. YMD61]
MSGLGIAIVFWLAAWGANVWIARHARGRLAALVPPVLFGVAVLVLWEGAVRAFAVPEVILPAPSVVAGAIGGNLGLLWGDFVQTIVKGAFSGYAMGCGAALVVAVLVDRSPMLTRGLLPVGNFVAALPIVGVAPIMVTWFGFGWQSKAAVVFAMVFFPVLVNAVAGLGAAERMHRDLMRTYGSGYWTTLFKLRLPAAMPFIFNGLKIATTLAVIGAIVAEFFGSPTRGMGFRISTAVGSLALPMVWAQIFVAALAGTLFYGFVALVEAKVTFWHPSQRMRG